jgi:hypothetical protein
MMACVIERVKERFDDGRSGRERERERAERKKTNERDLISNPINFELTHFYSLSSRKTSL